MILIFVITKCSTVFPFACSTISLLLFDSIIFLMHKSENSHILIISNLLWDIHYYKIHNIFISFVIFLIMNLVLVCNSLNIFNPLILKFGFESVVNVFVSMLFVVMQIWVEFNTKIKPLIVPMSVHIILNE